MARDFRKPDRDQSFLLPPDMRDWLPAGHLVWFLIDAIDQLNLVKLEAKAKLGGAGRRRYAPGMLLGLWIYASARGVSSSRQIERACHEDIAFRILCGQDAPDHTVLARFRKDHETAMADLFTQVLVLCVAGGLGNFGIIAIDGTKITANASKHKTVSPARLRKIAETELTKAAATDATEDAADAPTIDDEVPPSLGPGTDRPARIRRAIESAEAQIADEAGARVAAREEGLKKAEAELEAATTAADAAIREWDRRTEELGRRPFGGRPPVVRPRRVTRAEQSVIAAGRMLNNARTALTAQTEGVVKDGQRLASRNTTDPDSRMMRTRQGPIQGYNAQLAVTDDHLIITAIMTNAGNDLDQLIPTMDAAVQTAEALGKQIDCVVADNGYLTPGNIEAPGPFRLIAPGRERRTTEPTTTRTDPAAALMAERLTDETNQARYRRRSVTVEPVNGHLKDRRGLRQLARRGLTAAQAELHLAALTTNLLKLHNSNPATG